MARARRFEHTAIRASAGTGKTFALTNRYLQLCAAGERADRIVATTFTRKAAGEILQRILRRLAGGATDERELADLRKHLDAALTRERCAELLTGLVSQVHRLRIGTLDSVYVSLARAFALELGLPPDWSIAEESVDRQLREGAITDVLAEGAERDLVELMRHLNRGEARSSVSDQLHRLVRDMHDVYREAPDPAAWKWIPRQPTLDRAKVAQAIVRLRQLDLTHSRQLLSAWEKDVSRAASHDWESFVDKGLGGAVATDGTYNRKPLPPEVIGAYQPLVDHARGTLVNRLADQTLATFVLLHRFDSAYRSRQRRRRLLRFGDVTDALQHAELLDDTRTVYYRMDGSIAHLLLDEFQDTSLAQWRVLLPLAQEIAAHTEGERSLFCVGDRKQAIYGWRGGEAAIFDTLDESLHGSLRWDDLTRSFRSSRVIIDTVNAVFLDKPLPDNAALSRHREAVEAWWRGFPRHEAAEKVRDLAGYAELNVVGDEDQALVHAARLVADVVRRAPGRSVGALMRTNVGVARMIYLLRRQTPGKPAVPASEEGGNPLTDSPAVSAVLSLLHLADHPGDTAARFHVAASPLGRAVALTDPRDEKSAQHVSSQLRRRLLNEGYASVLFDLVRQLDGDCDARNLSRLLQLVELAYGYDARATLRAADFVRYVRQTKVEDPAAADVRVMTIHQAKGLQFDVVVLPELEGRLTGRTPAMLTDRPSPTQPIQRVCRYVPQMIHPWAEPLARMYADHQRAKLADSLSMLYVAITRPVHALHMFVAASKPNERTVPATFSGVLRSALAGDAPLHEAGVAWSRGDAQWYDHSPTKGVAPLVPAATVDVKLKPAEESRRRILPRITPSKQGGDRVDLAHLLRLERSEAMERGSVMHAWAQQIQWIDDGLPDDATLLASARAEVGDHPQLLDWLRQFRGYLDAPAIRTVLSRSTYAGEVELHLELPFAIRDGDHIVEGRFDRLVVMREGGRAVAADVLDFKTDAQPPAQIIEHYRPQMQAYRRAASKLLNLDESAVTAKLVLLAHGEAIAI